MVVNYDINDIIHQIRKIKIPYGSLVNYTNAPVWSSIPLDLYEEYFNSSMEYNETIQISTMTNDLNMGSVTPGGQFLVNDTILYFNAVSNDGYAFLCWQDGRNDNPRMITPNRDTTIMAFFYPLGELGDTTSVFDTVWLNDTIYVSSVPDTLLLQQYIHRTTITNILSQDTTVVEDSLYVNNFLPYPDPIHDTTQLVDTLWQYSTLYDTVTRIEYINDTTTILLVDTLLLTEYVHDTTTLTIYSDTLTLIEYVNDTTYLTEYDTIFNTEYIHDTTNVTLFDTIMLWQYDTIIQYADTLTLMEYVYDTVTQYFDTLLQTIYVTDTVNQYGDTLLLTEYVHDTIISFDTLMVFNTDTVSLTQYDTIIQVDTLTITYYDTLTLMGTRFDTVIVTDYIHDTITITVHDTVSVDNYIHDTTTVAVHDTVSVDNYIHDTITITVHDTVSVDNYIHDTTFVTVIDTLYLTVTDTVVRYDSIVFDTVFVPYYVHDTITVNEAVTYGLLSVMSNNLSYGIVAGSGQFPIGTSVEIAAIPLQGYQFVSWSDGSTENPHSIVLDEDSYYIATFSPSSVGVNNIGNLEWLAYAEVGALVVKGERLNDVQIFDELGRLLKTYSSPSGAVRFMVPSSGVYYVRVEGGGAKRVVVIR